MPTWGKMSLCDNPLEPFLEPASYAGGNGYPSDAGYSGGNGYPGGDDYPGSGGARGYPCDIYENPSEHYAALGQGLLYQGEQEDEQEGEGEGGQPPTGWAERSHGGGGWSGQPHQFFSQGEKIFVLLPIDKRT